MITRAVAVASIFVIVAGPARSQNPPQVASQAAFRYERTVTPGGKGANRLEIDIPLLVGSDPVRHVEYKDAEGKVWRVYASGLKDLRFFDATDTEVPYLLIAPPAPGARWVKGRILLIAARKGKSSGFEVDLGSGRLIDRIDVKGIPGPFLKKFRLEGSGDRSHWTLLEGEGTLFDLPEQKLMMTEVAFLAGEYRYFRLTWDDRSSAKVPAPASVKARVPGLVAPSPPLRASAAFKRLWSEPRKSRFTIELPGPNFPLATLQLTVRGGALLREATVTEARLSGEHVISMPLGSATLRRAGQGDAWAADLRVPVESPSEPEIELVVDDGDNPPLDLSGVLLETTPLPWILFESEDGEPLTARFGAGQMAAPRYDLESKRNLVPKMSFSVATWGEVRDLQPSSPSIPQTSPLPLVGATLDTKPFRYQRKIPVGDPGLTVIPLDVAVLAHSSLDDLRIVGAGGRQVPYLLERRGEPLSLPLTLQREEAADSKRAQDRRLTVYSVSLPYESLPASRLVIRTTSRVFERTITVSAVHPPAGRRDAPRRETLDRAVWQHDSYERQVRPLILSLPALRTALLEISVDEGDNSPLPIRNVEMLLPSYRLRFFHGAGVDLTLYYGSPLLARPMYDLALLAPRLMGASAHVLPLAPESAQPQAPAVSPWQKRLFWGVLILAAVVLLALFVRLMLKGGQQPASS